MLTRRPTSCFAFTLIELLVVISLITLLISMLLPSLASMKEEGRLTVCLSQQHAIGQAVRIYADNSMDAYPYGVPKPIDTVNHPHNETWRDGGRGGGVPPQQQFYDMNLLRDLQAWICPTDPHPGNYVWWDYDVHPDIPGGSSYMFSEYALFGVAWQNRIRLTFANTWEPSNFAYMTDGWECPNGWSWGRIDPWDPNNVEWYHTRIDWSHRNEVSVLFGDLHAARHQQRGAATTLRTHPRENF